MIWCRNLLIKLTLVLLKIEEKIDWNNPTNRSIDRSLIFELCLFCYLTPVREPQKKRHQFLVILLEVNELTSNRYVIDSKQIQKAKNVAYCVKQFTFGMQLNFGKSIEFSSTFSYQDCPWWTSSSSEYTRPWRKFVILSCFNFAFKWWCTEAISNYFFFLKSLHADMILGVRPKDLKKSSCWRRHNDGSDILLMFSFNVFRNLFVPTILIVLVFSR